MAIVAKGCLDTPLANQIKDMTAVVTNQWMCEKTNGDTLPYIPALVTSCLFKIPALDLFPTVLSSLLATNDGL